MTARGQPQSPVAEPVFGIGDREFLIGGWNLPYPNDAATDNVNARIAGIPQVIAWARGMGVNVFRLPEYYGYSDTNHNGAYDALVNAADTTTDIRFFLTHIPRTQEATYGLEAKFYLIPDSVPFKSWPCRFLYLNGGVTDTNRSTIEFDDWGQVPLERLYHRDSIAWGTTIADSIVLDWRPERTKWWNQYYDWPTSSWCWYPPNERLREPGRMFGEFWSVHDKKPEERPDTTFVVVTGHLDGLELPRADEDSTILWIDVYYDIGRDDKYFNPQASAVRTLPTNSSYLCTTLAVRWRDLEPADPLGNWDRYEAVSLPFDAGRCLDTLAGPLHESAGLSRRINLRVRYAGNATVAIRSIALRDWTAEQVLSETAEGLVLRDSMRAEFSRLIRRTPPDTSRHRSIIGFAADGEQSPIQAASTRHVSTWLSTGHHEVRDFWNDRDDSIGVWLEGLHVEDAHLQLSYRDSLGRVTVVAPEFSSTQDRVEDWMRKQLVSPTAPWVGLKAAVREHNGGQFGLPELVLNRDSIEYFERLVQIRHLSQYLPDAPESFLFNTRIGKHARLARDLRKRLIVIPFASSNVWVNMRVNSEHALEIDSGSFGLDRIQEPAELRNAVNISLAMGVKGIFWQVLTHGIDFLDPSPQADGDTTWYGCLRDWPIAGEFTGDTTAQDNRIDTLWFESVHRPKHGRGDFTNTRRFSVPDFWTGWGVRSRAVREHNHWLAQVGPELMKLTWRDAYSIHAQRPISYTTSYKRDCPDGTWVNTHDSTAARTIPSNEIITKVTAKDPRTGLFDHDSTTYVELGLFDMKPGWRFDTTAQQWRSDQMLDSHHVVVVNRRVFEPTYDIAPGARRDAMVALAGTRTVTLQLNLPRGARYRVREIEPDVAPLPGATATRTPLDVVVAGDAEVAITLGPGRAALVRIARDRQE
jgi:hypothetical protein